MMLALVSSTPWAAPTGSAAAEIDHLFAYLGSSGCTFNRNGTWYSAAQAVEHLRGKYDYLLTKGFVTTAESFVDQAASRSSMSGKPYLVRCGSAQPIESGPWFHAELTRYRYAKRPTANESLQSTPVTSLRSSPVAADLHR
jgi:Family of unknown function (DUF5329)